VLIRTRLAAAMAVLFTFVVCALGVAVYQVTRSTVLSQIREDVVARAAAAATALTRQPDTTPHAVVAAVTTETVFVEFTDSAGEPLARSPNSPPQPLAPDPARLPPGSAVERRVDDLPLLVAAQQVTTPAGTRYVVVARTPQPAYEALGRLRAVLIPAVLISAGLTAAVVWLSVRRSLAPLTRLVVAAETIGQQRDHHGRTGITGRADEIGRLAATIDEMLAALEDSHRAVAEAHQAQRRFLTDVSHELRAPLTIMLSSLELAQRIGSSDPAFITQVMTDVRSEVERMARRVTQLLTMARTGNEEIHTHRPLLLADLLAELCLRWSRGGRTIDCHAHSPADTVISGNEDHLRQVFEILLDNACKYTPPEGRVWVECSATNGTVTVTVADTGPGIPADRIPPLFDRYVRGDLTPRATGLGLGLSIARHIVTEHTGTIDVASEPGRGSRFTVRLPRAVDHPGRPCGTTVPFD
jgi:two-component system, OmpR family, sensor kinase